MEEAIGSGRGRGKIRKAAAATLCQSLPGRGDPDTRVLGLAKDSSGPQNRHIRPVPLGYERTKCPGTTGI